MPRRRSAANAANVARHQTAGFHHTAYFVALHAVLPPFVMALQLGLSALGHPFDDAAKDVIATWSVTLSLAFVGVPLFERAYGSRRRWAALQSAVVALLVAVGLQGYRLVVFLLTLFTTR